MDIVFAYTPKDAVEDGEMIDANTGDFAEVSRQHYKYPVYMTRRVFETIERAVDNERWGNDYKGVWHDILWMSRVAKTMVNESTVVFKVIIRGAGKKTHYDMVAMVSPFDVDDMQPVVIISFADED